MSSPYQTSKPPATLLFWTLTDEVIERPDVLARQFHEIRESGFGGVAAFVRCSRYNWHDEPARKAFVRIGKLCKRHHMQNWIGPDPRFVSRNLIPSTGGLEVLMFGDRARAEVFPNYRIVENGRFSVRCDVAPRHVHTLQEVAIEYSPLGIERLYALRFEGGGKIPVEVQDVTPYAQFFYNARKKYVEAFGDLPARFLKGDWRVLAFFRSSTNHVDFADRNQMRRYLSMLEDLKDESIIADGLMWDEPGFTCTYGTLPYSPAIRNLYTRSTSRSIEKDLWKLALDAPDGSHRPVRKEYYRGVQHLLNAANAQFTRRARKLWGKATVSGIHDTWHWESADMCDMNHGSLDLWKAAKSKTGGFVDLGGVDKLRDPGSPWNAHLAAMSVICASLGKKSPGGYAYNNLWTVGDDDGEGWQATVMDHCVNTMALFGTRWLAHCYGPVGTIGEEQSFLGSPPMPGYPNHSTWRYYPAWNRRLQAHLGSVEQNLPSSNLLLLFPVESLYALAGPAADRAATLFFNLVLAMLDNHYHVDVLSPSACSGARWSQDEYVVGRARYSAVIAPFVNAEQSRSLRLSAKKRTLVLEHPEREGGQVESASIISAVAAWLGSIPGIRPVTAPARCWATTTPVSNGTVVSLSPARHGYRYSGQVSFAGRHVELGEECSGLTRILFPDAGSPHILPGNADFSI